MPDVSRTPRSGQLGGAEWPLGPTPLAELLAARERGTDAERAVVRGEAARTSASLSVRPLCGVAGLPIEAASHEAALSR